jgi:hypothetical protein
MARAPVSKSGRIARFINAYSEKTAEFDSFAINGLIADSE